MTPPSTLRLTGIAAILVSLVILGAGHADSAVRRHPMASHSRHESRWVHAAPQPARVEQIVADARKAELEAKLAEVQARAVAVMYDSVARTIRVKVAPVAVPGQRGSGTAGQ